MQPGECPLSVYIYSMPKAGTYFFAAFLKALGLEDTGFHIDRMEYLDTRSQPMDVNMKAPGKARVKQFFVPVVRRLAPHQVAFGHFPLPIHYEILGQTGFYVCAYRDPRRTLVSEFIDFRFRRTGVKWALPAAVPDDGAAFLLYLTKQGMKGHLGIFRDMVLLRSITLSPFCPPILQTNTCFVNFDEIRANPKAALPLARFLQVELSEVDVLERLETALGTETKTKATEIALDRDALWTDEAEALYAKSRFPAIKAMAEELGLEF